MSNKMKVNNFAVQRELSLGFVRFVLLRGVLTFGVMSATLVLVLGVLFLSGPWTQYWGVAVAMLALSPAWALLM